MNSYLLQGYQSHVKFKKKSLRIWAQVADSTCFDNNRYAMYASI